MPIDTEHFKALLEERQSKLLAIAESGKNAAKPVELDQTTVGRLSRMDAMQLQAMAIATAERRENELQRIKAAFKRLESSDYGYCITCNEEISIKRLELDPTTLTCIHCAGKSS